MATSRAPLNWARHLLVLRDLQAETGGFTEFVPLPFVHMEAPMYLRGMARKGPTLREAILMHAVSRLVLHPLITNIQTSWVKMGPEGAAMCLNAGANDLGGTLMNESISRAAGTQHGQEFPPEAMEQLIGSLARAAGAAGHAVSAGVQRTPGRGIQRTGAGAGRADAAAQGDGGGVEAAQAGYSPNPSSNASVRVGMRGRAAGTLADRPGDRCPARSPASARSWARSPAGARRSDGENNCRRQSATALPRAARTARRSIQAHHAPARW